MSEKTYLIGVDVGTMGTKSDIFDTEGDLIPTCGNALAYINGGGLNLRWLRVGLAKEKKAAAEREDRNIYALLDEAVASVPAGADCLRLLALPWGNASAPAPPTSVGSGWASPVSFARPAFIAPCWRAWPTHTFTI